MTITETTRHLTASMVVIDPAARSVLLVHHNLMGKWVFPGGHLDEDETLAECAVREVLEETDLEVTVFDHSRMPLPGMEWHPSPWITAAIPAPANPHEGEPAHMHIDHLFIGLGNSRQPLKPAMDEVAQARWFPYDEIDPDTARAEVRYLTGLASVIVGLETSTGVS